MNENELNTNCITYTSICYRIETRHHFINMLRQVHLCFTYDKNTHIEIVVDVLNNDYYIHLCFI